MAEKHTQYNPSPSYYAIIPAEVRYDKRLSSSEKLIYAEITALSEKTGSCWASNEYFADLYGVAKETVSRWITRLSELGYISRSVVRKDGSSQIDARIIQLTKTSIPSKQKHQYPIDKKVKENTTRENTTRINTVETSVSPEKNMEFKIISFEKETLGAPGITLPTKDGGEWELPHEKYIAYRECFSNIDIDYQLKKIKIWLNDNQQKRKTKRGMPKFISGWLGRENDRATVQKPSVDCSAPRF